MIDFPTPVWSVPETAYVGEKFQIESKWTNSSQFQVRTLDSNWPMGLEMLEQNDSAYIWTFLPYRVGKIQLAPLCFELSEGDLLLVRCTAAREINVLASRYSLPQWTPNPSKTFSNESLWFGLLALIGLIGLGSVVFFSRRGRLFLLGRGWSPWSLHSDLLWLEAQVQKSPNGDELRQELWQLRFGPQGCTRRALMDWVGSPERKWQ